MIRRMLEFSRFCSCVLLSGTLGALWHPHVVDAQSLLADSLAIPEIQDAVAREISIARGGSIFDAYSRETSIGRGGEIYDAFSPEVSIGRGQEVFSAFSREVSIGRYAADLVLSGFGAPDNAVAGQGIYVRWTVSNAGSTAAFPPWRDSVYLSKDGTLGDRVGTWEWNNRLPADSTYTREVGISIPADVSQATYYALTFVTDTSGEVGELNEGNDNSIRFEPLVVVPAPFPDLAADSLEISPTVVRGAPFEASWRTKNVSTVSTSTPRWVDAIYLAADSLPPSQASSLKPLAEFTNQTYLISGGGYIQTKDVLLPANTAPDTYYVLVVPDGDDDVEEGSHNEEDFIAQRIEVLPGDVKLPDLDVTSFPAPGIGFEGNPLELSWTVANLGSLAVDPGPVDWVMLSENAYVNEIPNPHLDRHLNGDFRGKPLPENRPDSTYTLNEEVTLPPELTGDFYLYIWSDVELRLDDVDVANNFSDVRPITILPAGKPDLTVGVNAPTRHSKPISDTVVSGSSIGIHWDTMNLGSGQGRVRHWVDRIYLSTDTLLSTETDIHVARVPHSGFITHGSESEFWDMNSHRARIPGDTPADDYYILVAVDADGDVPEEPDNQPNVASWPLPITVIDPVPVNLEIAFSSAPDTAASGRPLHAIWQVTNIAPVATTVDHWEDRLYLSIDGTFQGLLGKAVSKPRNAALPGDKAYSATATVDVPDGFTGDIWLVAETDYQGVVFEAGDTDNNRTARQIHIELSEPANLVVNAIEAPATARTRETVSLTYSVRNAGTGTTYVGGWKDRVYLSSDPLQSVQTLDKLEAGGSLVQATLATPSPSRVLAPGEEIEQSVQVKIPKSFAGDSWFIVRTNIDDTVYEPMGDDNAASTPVYIDQTGLPDLRFDALDFEEGIVDSVHYVVENHVTLDVPPQVHTWVNRFYLSEDKLLDETDALIGSGTMTEQLGQSGVFAQTIAVFPPGAAEGSFYVLGAIDAEQNVEEDNENNNLSQEYNGSAPDSLNPDPEPVDVPRTPPDLQVTQVPIPTAMTSGQPFDVSWKVANLGSGMTQRDTWSDELYLSEDRIIGASDILLGTYLHENRLGVGDTTLAALNVEVPLGVSADQYVIVMTDARKQIYEHTHEDNNIGISVSRTPVTVPPLADLQVSQVDTPTQGLTGTSVDFSWTVVNTVGTVTGLWSDAVYLSADSAWSIDDVHLGEVELMGPLAAGAQYTQKLHLSGNQLEQLLRDLGGALSTDLPGLLPEDYHVVVRTDIRNNIPESNELNNENSTTTPMTVDMDSLTAGVAACKQIDAWERHYYKVFVPSDSDVRVGLQVVGMDDELELYTQFGAPPNRAEYEHLARVRHPGYEAIRSRTDDYLYILVFGSRVLADGGHYCVSVEFLPFGLETAWPSSVGNAGYATIEFTGGRFGMPESLRLSGPGGELLAWDLTLVEPTRLRASFDFRDVALGAYDAILQTDAGVSKAAEARLDTLVAAVTVIDGEGPIVVPEIRGPGSIRQNSPVVYEIELVNAGDADAYDVITGLSLLPKTPDGTITYELLTDSGTSGPFVTTGEVVHVLSDWIPVQQTDIFRVRLSGNTSLLLDVTTVGNDPGFFATPDREGPLAAWLPSTATAFRDVTDASSASPAVGDLEEELADSWIASRGRTLPLADALTTAYNTSIDSLSATPANLVEDTQAAAIDSAIAHAKRYFNVEAQAQKKKVRKKKRDVALLVARDPNAKVGPSSSGDAFVSQNEALPYTIYFENVASAQAAAQQVLIVDQLDSLLNWSSFRLGEIAFAGQVVTVPPNRSFWQKRIRLEPPLLLDIAAGVNANTGEARWYLAVLDSTTGYPPTDPDVGLLLPNDETARGEGYVFYTIEVDDDAPEGDTIRNKATIIFDDNEAIVTNEVSSTLHRTYPDLSVSSASSTSGLLEGAPVQIEALVSNPTDIDVDVVTVSFFAGDVTPGNRIGDILTLHGLSAGSETPVEVTWRANVDVADSYPVTVVVDEPQLLQEANEDNNTREVSVKLLPRQYEVSLQAGLNVIAPPLASPIPWTAQSLSAAIDASMVVKHESMGTFSAFIAGDPSSDNFSLETGVAYIVDVDSVRSLTFSGVSGPEQVPYPGGLNALSLTRDTNDTWNAQSIADQLHASQLIRYNTTTQNFEVFVPALHTDDGFALRGGEGYFAVLPDSGLATYHGVGWHGQQPEQQTWVDAKPNQVAGTALFALHGAVRQKIWDELCTPVDGTRLLVKRDGEQGSREVEILHGDYAHVFLDFDAASRTHAGMRLEVQGIDEMGTPFGEIVTYEISEDDIQRRHVRVDLMLAAAPRVSRLFQNFPNPFNPTTTVRFQLAAPGQVRLRIFDVRGRLVRTLVDEVKAPGYYEIPWNGLGNRQQRVASGVYFYDLQAPGFRQTRKMVLLK